MPHALPKFSPHRNGEFSLYRKLYATEIKVDYSMHFGFFFFTLFKKSVGPVSFFSPLRHLHIHTVFKHYHGQDAMIEKQKFVQCNWLVKIGEKSRMKWTKKELCGCLQRRRQGRSGHWVWKFLRIRILEILQETPFFGSPSQPPDTYTNQSVHRRTLLWQLQRYSTDLPKVNITHF